MPRYSEYATHEGAPAAEDRLLMRDVSDTSMAPTGTTKEIAVLDLLSGAGGGGDATRQTISQETHGLAVGDVVRHTGQQYALAQANSPASAEALGVVGAVPDPDHFVLVYAGLVEGLSGLSAGEVYFLSDTVPGGLTATEPALSKPMLVATSATSGVVVNYRGLTGGSGSASANAQTGTSYTLQAADYGRVVTFDNASPITLTVPSGLTPNFSCVLIQLGSGQVTVSGSGATVNASGGANKLNGQYAKADLHAYGEDLFVVSGNLTT